MIAYKSQALPVTASFPDVFAQAFEGRSLTVAASADYQMTAAFGVHDLLSTQKPQGNNFAFVYDSMVTLVSSILQNSEKELLEHLR